MKKITLLIAVVAISALATGGAPAPGRGGHAGGGGPAAGAPGGGHGGGGQGAGAPGGWHGGGAPAHGWNGGGWRGGGQPGYWYGNRWAGGYGGWYGSGVGVYFGGPLWGGAYGYPYSFWSPAPAYYAYPGYYPYPAYVERGPIVYIQRPPMVAAAPPRVATAPPAAAPQFERFTLSAKELFAFDRAELASPQPKLDRIAVALLRNPQVTGVRVIGYTDRLGSEAYNLTLSRRRADAVKAYLVGKGVAAERLVAIGMGEANPVVKCTQTAHAALIACLEPNRRVEIEPITIERPVG